MTGDLKILIVDEDQEYCARLSDRLRREGFIVSVVNSTTEAISSCDLPSPCPVRVSHNSVLL